MARFQLFISVFLAFYLRVATADYNQWSDLPDCAHYCFSFAVNNMMAPCNYDLECVCVSRRTDFVGIATVCLSGEAGTPCANNTVAHELITYGNNVFCNASNKNGIIFDVVSGGTTYRAALDSQATGQAEVRNAAISTDLVIRFITNTLLSGPRHILPMRQYAISVDPVQRRQHGRPELVHDVVGEFELNCTFRDYLSLHVINHCSNRTWSRNQLFNFCGHDEYKQSSIGEHGRGTYDDGDGFNIGNDIG